MKVTNDERHKSNPFFMMLSKINASPIPRIRALKDTRDKEASYIAKKLRVHPKFMGVSGSVMTLTIETLKQKRDEYMTMVREIRNIQLQGATEMMKIIK